MLRRFLLVAACSSLAAMAAARLAGAYVSRALSALPRITASATGSSGPVSHGEAPAAEFSEAAMTAGTPPLARPRGEGRRPRTAKRPRAREQLSDELARGIRKLAEHRYEIARTAFELAQRNVAALTAWIRVAPDIRDGKSSGFRLVWVTVDGPFAKLGLRTDDVLVSVNGLDIRTPDSALEAVAKLKLASRFAVGFVRDGRELLHDYAIR